eukprot:Skav204565  [mRNA]  locus=scaffold2682:172692:173483:+ [translate_table: standard]
MGALCETKEEPIDSEELTDRLMELLAKQFEKDELTDVSSHSLKSTLLSYLNIFGADYLESELLGYHVNKEHGSDLNYTRDALSAPMRTMVGMMSSINSGRFTPASPRDEVFTAVGFEVSLKKAFEDHYGMTVIEAAKALNGMGEYSSAEEDRRGRERLERLSSDKVIPLSGMVVRLGSDDGDQRQPSSDSEEFVEMEMGHAVVDMMNGSDHVRGPGTNCDQMTVLRHARTKMVHYGHILSSSFVVYKEKDSIAMRPRSEDLNR